MHHLVIAFGQMEPILLQCGIKSSTIKKKKKNAIISVFVYNVSVAHPGPHNECNATCDQ